MSSSLNNAHDVERYRPLGLLANPFIVPLNATGSGGIELEIYAAANELLGSLYEAARQPKARPIAVMRSEKIPQSYALRAIGETEQALANDESVGALHAYVQLFMMRLGRVRSIISILAERLAFRDFGKTLELYVGEVLRNPDTELISYQVLGEENYKRLEEEFEADPADVTERLFGRARVERRPELDRLADTRIADLKSDVDEDEALPEIDSTVGDSPANAVLLAEAETETEEDNNNQALVDYIVEHTQVHLSPVVARALRVYRERGLSAMVAELKVTKAPKKTLAAIVQLARCRFSKVALVFDGFEGWHQVPPETRSLIAATMSELRWKLESDAVMVFVLEKGEVAELEEQFGGGTRLEWNFAGVPALEQNGELLDSDLIENWLRCAAYPDAEPLTMADPVLARLLEMSDGLAEFVARAAAAIEDAADRSVPKLDDAALGVGSAVGLEEASA